MRKAASMRSVGCLPPEPVSDAIVARLACLSSMCLASALLPPPTPTLAWLPVGHGLLAEIGRNWSDCPKIGFICIELTR
jgi:hypothetical protein